MKNKRVFALSLIVTLLAAMTTSAYADELNILDNDTVKHSTVHKPEDCYCDQYDKILEANSSFREITMKKNTFVSLFIKESTLRQYALKVIELVNAERAKVDVGPVTETEMLYIAASARAKELEALFSHTRIDGREGFSILSDFDIARNAWSENIGAGQKTPQQIVDGWMNSDGHRKNLLNPNYTKIGVGIYMDASGRLYWAQLFID